MIGRKGVYSMRAQENCQGLLTQGRIQDVGQGGAEHAMLLVDDSAKCGATGARSGGYPSPRKLFGSPW